MAYLPLLKARNLTFEGSFLKFHRQGKQFRSILLYSNKKDKIFSALGVMYF